MSDYLDTLNALLPEGMHFEWAAEPAAGPEFDVAEVTRVKVVLRQQILGAFGLPEGTVGAAPRSAFSSAYRQRQRNRVKGRRR